MMDLNPRQLKGQPGRDTMKTGTTTYGFRYALLDVARAPSLPALLDQARAMGLDRLQVCENARPLTLPPGEWKRLIGRAADMGLEIQFGCMTLDPEVLSRYLQLAALTTGRTLRIVLEDASGEAPERRDVSAFLETAAPLLQAAGVRLAIENHFHIPCRVLAELASAFPASLVGFCVDSANSLRCFESAGTVLDVLGPRAVSFHIKDYRVHGTNVGFSVSGAPLGAGDFDAAGFLARVLAINPDPAVFIETWVPATGDWATDTAADRSWLEESIRNLRRLAKEV